MNSMLRPGIIITVILWKDSSRRTIGWETLFQSLYRISLLDQCPAKVVTLSRVNIMMSKSSVCLSVCLSVLRSFGLFVRLSVYLSGYPSMVQVHYVKFIENRRFSSCFRVYGSLVIPNKETRPNWRWWVTCIIMQLLDLWWQYWSVIKKVEFC